MSDRVLRVFVAISLAIHLLAAYGSSRAGLSTTVVRLPAASPPVRVRLKAPAPAASRPAPSRPASAEPVGGARPAVSAPPHPKPLSERRPDPRPLEAPTEAAAPKPIPEPMPEPAIASAIPSTSPATTSPEVEAMPHGDAPVSADEALALVATAATAARGHASDALSASASTEDEEDRLARYVEAIRARIQDRKRYPPLARKRAVEGRVVARVAIRADGAIAAIEFDGAAPPLLRRATDDAIRGASPYPAPPAGAVTIEFPIEYSLRDAS